jgi:hypothetical protein
VQPRLLRCLYGLGTNAGLKRVVAGDPSLHYHDLLYMRRRYMGFQEQSPDFVRLAEYRDKFSRRYGYVSSIKTIYCEIFVPDLSSGLAADTVKAHGERRLFSPA